MCSSFLNEDKSWCIAVHNHTPIILGYSTIYKVNSNDKPPSFISQNRNNQKADILYCTVHSHYTEKSFLSKIKAKAPYQIFVTSHVKTFLTANCFELDSILWVGCQPFERVAMPFKQLGLSVFFFFNKKKHQPLEQLKPFVQKQYFTLSAVLMNLSLSPGDFLAAALWIWLFGLGTDRPLDWGRGELRPLVLPILYCMTL